MSHNATSRRAPAPTSLAAECPLASLGRNSSAVMDTLNGHHTHTLQYHHPLSSSPLDPQAYQMSRNSPNLSIEADDIIYAGNTNSLHQQQQQHQHQHQQQQQQQQQQHQTSDAIVSADSARENLLLSLNEITRGGTGVRNGLSSSSHGCLPEMYTLSRSSSHSSLEHGNTSAAAATPTAPRTSAASIVQQKAATFELRGRHAGSHGNGIGHMYTAHSAANVARQQQHQQRTLPAKQTQPISNGTPTLPQPPTASARNFLTLEHMLQYGRPNAYLLHGNSADTEDSSDTAGGSGGRLGGGGSHGGTRSTRLNRQQGGRCSVPTVTGGNSTQYYLEKKMDALYLGNALRGLPLGAEASNFQSERYYLEDGMRGVCDYGSGNERMTDGHLLHHRASSPSETSGSDRYLLNRTNSPANAFSSLNQLDNFSSANHNTSSSSSNLALDQRYHHQTKVQSLTDGLCNLGRFSPSLDQGYATLVSPSPTGHNTHPTNAITTHSIVHHPPPLPNVAAGNLNAVTSATTGGATLTPVSTSTSTTTTTTARRATADTAIGPPPWNRKGPFRAGPYFDRLPDEAIVKIFSWFDSCELCNVARVCRRFEQVAWRPVLWKVITLRGEHLNGDKTLKMIFRQLCGQSRNGACPEVERVMLADGCRITDKGLQLLTRRCPELTHLQLQTCVNVSNQALVDALTKCGNLQHLDVTGCSQVTSITPNPNMEPPRRLLLQYLDLTDCMAIDDLGLKIVVKNCPQLVYLYLRRCIQITDAGLKFVPSFCVSLKELSVSDCMNITDFGLYELAKLGAALRYLSVAKCERVSDAGLKVIARRCYKLRYLNARGCEAVSDDSITVLARSCPRLRALDIGKCDVSDAGLRALAESCPNLKKLSLRNCDMITDRGVQCIAYYCRGLQQLNIQDCQISIEGYRAVKKYCKRCIIEHTNPGFC